MTTPTFSHENLINLSCIANRHNKSLEEFAPAHTGEKTVMEKINSNLEYYKDIATDAEMIKSMRDLIGKTESQLQETRSKKGSAESAIEKAKSEIEEQKKQIEEIEKQMAEGVVELSDTLKGQNISLENINVEKTANLTKDLFKADSISDPCGTSMPGCWLVG